MMQDPFEDKLRGFDDRFEVTGELLLDLGGDARAEIDRVIFAWKLCNPDEDLSMQDLVLVVTGDPDEIEKIVSAVKLAKAQGPKAKKGAQGPKAKGAGKAWAMMRLRKEVMHEVLASAVDEKMGKLPFFMMGDKRPSMVFDMHNYDLVAWEA